MKKNIISYALIILLLSSCSSKLDFTAPSTPVTPPVGSSDLLISEVATAINTYTGPTGTKARNHYVELYNGTTGSLDLSNYAVGYQAVTDTNTLSPWNFPDTTFFITLKGTVATKNCFVIASPQADTDLIKSNITWGTTSTASADAVTSLQLSGNSALALLKKDTKGTFILSGNKYKIIDVFCSPLVARIATTGKTSARNNIIWAVADTTNDTRNRTFWRKPSITAPQSDWSISNAAGNSQWEISLDKVWDYTNVGLPTAH